jgi:hypothetical protein
VDRRIESSLSGRTVEETVEYEGERGLMEKVGLCSEELSAQQPVGLMQMLGGCI